MKPLIFFSCTDLSTVFKSRRDPCRWVCAACWGPWYNKSCVVVHRAAASALGFGAVSGMGGLIVRIVRIMPYGWRAVCSATDGIWLFLATKRRSPTWFILILIFGVVYFWYFLLPRIGHSMKERWYLNLAAQACHKGRLHSIFIKWPWLCVQGL